MFKIKLNENIYITSAVSACVRERERGGERIYRLLRFTEVENNTVIFSVICISYL